MTARDNVLLEFDPAAQEGGTWRPVRAEGPRFAASAAPDWETGLVAVRAHPSSA